MHERRSTELAIPTEAIPALKSAAEALTRRLGRRLNYAQAYIALASAQASGNLDPIGCRDYLEHATDPALIETVATLLEADGALLDELQSKAKLQGFD